MAQRILRPLDYGGIIDELFDLYKKNFLLFFGISAIVYVPVYVLIFAFAGLEASNFIQIIGYVPMQIAAAVSTWAIGRCYLGQKVTIGESYGAIKGRALAFIATMIVVGIITGLGVLACIVGAIVLGVLYSFVPQVFMLEGLSGKEARVRSWGLVKDSWVRVVVTNFIAGLISSVVSGVLMFPLFFLIGFLVSSGGEMTGAVGILFGLIMALAVSLASPIQVIASVLVYYDIRVRKEGFDIEMLASNMNESTNEEQPAEQQLPRF